MRTVVALAANEMGALCVHDAYAVLAAHAEQFHITNREELIMMYDEMFQDGGPLSLLGRQNGGYIDTTVGSFDLKQVQKATYACS